MTIEIGLLIALVGGIIGVATFFIGRQTAAKKDGEQWGEFKAELKTDITYIKRDVGEIKSSVNDNSRENRESIRRVHDRLDAHLREDHGMTIPKRED